MSVVAASKVRRKTAGTRPQRPGPARQFPSEDGVVRAVRGIDFDLAAGEVLGIVGESGSGKSVTSLAIMGLLPPRRQRSPARSRCTATSCSARATGELSKIRGNELAMVFQDPLSALTPIYTVG